MSEETSSEPKKRILFVDDEQRVLDGIAVALRRKRKEWQMGFACGGKLALEELERGKYDIVVSDMRMPGMDGEALLKEVQRLYPGLVRMILSGHTDSEVSRRMIHVAHQFLAKPCEPDALKQTLERACDLHSLLGQSSLRELVGGLGQLPAAPRVFTALQQLLEHGEPPLNRIAEVVSRDPALCAKLLQLVNSAFFSLPQATWSVERAVALLGIETLKSIVLSIEVLEAAGSRVGKAAIGVDAIHARAMRVGRLARAIAPQAAQRDQAFMAGMLHPIGVLLLSTRLSADFSALLKAAKLNKEPLNQLEQQRFGATHAELGAYLLGIWGLAPSLVEAIAHYPEPRRLAPQQFELPVILHVAVALTAEADDLALDHIELDLPLLHELGVGDRIDDWRAMAQGGQKES